MLKEEWSHLRNLNPRPADYKSAALPSYAKVADNAVILISFITISKTFVKIQYCKNDVLCYLFNKFCHTIYL